MWKLMIAALWAIVLTNCGMETTKSVAIPLTVDLSPSRADGAMWRYGGSELAVDVVANDATASLYWEVRDAQVLDRATNTSVLVAPNELHSFFTDTETGVKARSTKQPLRFEVHAWAVSEDGEVSPTVVRSFCLLD